MKFFLRFLLALATMFACVMAFGFWLLINKTPEERAAFEAQRAAEQSQEQRADPTLIAVLSQDKIKTLLRNPESAEWLQAVLVEKPSGERFFCATVRAQNGFGGYGVESFVVTPEGLVSQAQKSWKAHCVNQKVIARLRG